jgi:hypothetical protein
MVEFVCLRPPGVWLLPLLLLVLVGSSRCEPHDANPAEATYVTLGNDEHLPALPTLAANPAAAAGECVGMKKLLSLLLPSASKTLLVLVLMWLPSSGQSLCLTTLMLLFFSAKRPPVARPPRV